MSNFDSKIAEILDPIQIQIKSPFSPVRVVRKTLGTLFR